MAKLAAGFPSSPLVDPTSGEITPVWRSFLLSMFARTGGAAGTTPPASTAAIAIETTNRVAADAALASNIANEGVARAIADAALTTAIADEAAARRADRSTGGVGVSAEAAARLAADSALGAMLAAETTARGLADSTETAARISGDTAAHIMTLDFSTLPTADPGHGRIWLSGLAVSVGSLTTSIDLESGSGSWDLEDGSGGWEFS